MALRSFVCGLLALLAASLGAAERPLTPAQTEGPFYPDVKPAETDNDLTRVGASAPAQGKRLLLRGVVVNPAGVPVTGARVEIWQTDANGVYLHSGDPNLARRDRGFQGYGEAVTGADGSFAFRTIVPGLYEPRARHIHAKVVVPGGATLTTQFYFADDARRAQDGIARATGAAIERLTLHPQEIDLDGERALVATVTVVVRR
jgi:protocatechuate 3,4-dioxygenase beta subunit